MQRPGSACSQRSDLSRNSMCKSWKIVVLGAPKVGKTSLVYKFITGELPNWKAGHCDDLIPEFMEKKMKLPDVSEESIYVSVWNLPRTASQPGDVSKSFYNGAHGCLFVFSTIDQFSFTDLAEWYTAVMGNCGDIPVAFAENKIDLIDDSVLNQKDVESMAKNYKMRLYRTSAKADHNVSEVFNYLVTKAVQKFPDPATSESRGSSADSTRASAGDSVRGSSNSLKKASKNSHSTGPSVKINGEAYESPESVEPRKRRTGGVKPIINRHACRLM